MITLFRTLIIGCGILFSSLAFALGSNTNHAAIFQVIQTQMVFNHSTVESATILSPKMPANTYDINLKLKPSVVNQFSALTQANIGKQVNILLNGKIISSTTIQSKLGGEFLITGLTKAQANAFVKSLDLKNS